MCLIPLQQTVSFCEVFMWAEFKARPKIQLLEFLNLL